MALRVTAWGCGSALGHRATTVNMRPAVLSGKCWTVWKGLMGPLERAKASGTSIAFPQRSPERVTFSIGRCRGSDLESRSRAGAAGSKWTSAPTGPCAQLPDRSQRVRMRHGRVSRLALTGSRSTASAGNFACVGPAEEFRLQRRPMAQKVWPAWSTPPCCDRRFRMPG